MKRKKLISFLCLLLLIVAGVFYFRQMAECLASGGGLNFSPPFAIEKNKPLTMTLGLNMWGKTKCIQHKYWLEDKPSKLFSKVQCHYRIKGESSFKDVSMNLVKDTLKDAAYYADYTCTIPAQNSDSQLEYYFDYNWGDAYYKQDEKPIPFK